MNEPASAAGTAAPRSTMPEPLSGLPETAAIEIAPGRPWLSVNETNRLARLHGLGAALAQAWVLDELLEAISLPDAEEKALMREFLARKGIKDDSAVAGWLERERISFDDLRALATKARRLELFRTQRWADEAETRFLDRKLELDQVVYSLLRTKDPDLADELYQRIKEGEADFAELAPSHSEGSERLSRGQIGPVPLAAGHESLVSRLRVGSPGQLWPPFQAGDTWVVLRLDSHIPAQLTDETRARMLNELFQQWFQARVKLLLEGEPLPNLPPLP